MNRAGGEKDFELRRAESIYAGRQPGMITYHAGQSPWLNTTLGIQLGSWYGTEAAQGFEIGCVIFFMFIVGNV